mgnify:CR=1 FL=1
MALRSLTPIQTVTAYLRALEEWLSLNVFLLAREMQLADVLYDDLFNNLPKEKQSELTGRKDYFAKKAGITL